MKFLITVNGVVTVTSDREEAARWIENVLERNGMAKVVQDKDDPLCANDGAFFWPYPCVGYVIGTGEGASWTGHCIGDVLSYGAPQCIHVFTALPPRRKGEGYRTTAQRAVWYVPRRSRTRVW